MEHFQINKRNKVDTIKELEIRKFFEIDNSLFIVFENHINYKLTLGQTLMFKRQIYKDDETYRYLSDDVHVTAFSSYTDTNYVTYDAIYTTKVSDTILTPYIKEVTSFVFWDLDEDVDVYVSANTETVSFLEYQQIDIEDFPSYDNWDPSEHVGEEKPKHLVATYTEDRKYTYFDSVRHFVDEIPQQYDPYYHQDLLSGYTSAYSDIDEYMKANTDLFVCFSGISQSESVLDFMQQHPEIFTYDLHDEGFVLTFREPHNVYFQDLYLAESSQYILPYDLNVIDINGDKIGTLSGLKAPIEGIDRSVDFDDLHTDSIENTCGMFDVEGQPYDVTIHNYFFLPSGASLYSLIVTSGNCPNIMSSITDTERTYNLRQITYLLNNGVEFVPTFNPYYYMLSSPLGECVFWHDTVWGELSMANNAVPRTDIWINCGDTRAYFSVNESYYKVCINPICDSNNNIGREDDLNDYINDEIESLIPKQIDFEKVKYVPITSYDDISKTYTRLSEISFYFHFRKRKTINNNTTLSFPYPIYDSGWYIDPESASTIWWNGMNYNGVVMDSQQMEAFYNANSGKSDMIGYLGFTDEDVLNQKSKLTNTFVRLSFYTSKNAVDQKLLYYSTVFLDTSSMFGKYLREMEYREDNNLSTLYPLVFFYDENCGLRLDSKLTITGEQDMTTSSEGFNLYLFKDDVQETSARTIYMKVEFNHAGNGKTIPMILWPKDENGDYESVTTQNFFDSVYIPIILRYINGKYTYEIQGASICEDKAELPLFEIKLDHQYITNA